ncbi:MAG: arylsulfatase [Planctomycetes bacterium]|nr:arylsulfatase [Planctomycetota bacterium]
MADDRRPNVVLILTDDQGWGDLSLNGNTNLSTPRIDELGREGAVFESFYVQPLCAPTRAEVLTGRYFPRTGVHGVTRRAEYLNLDETTIGDVFQSAGYATGCFGKWHSGSAYPYHPNGRGFEEFFGFCCGHWSNYFSTTLDHNGEDVENSDYIIDVLTEKAMEFIETNRDRPFFCYVPYNVPHSPFQVPDRFYEKFSGKELEMRHRDPDKEDGDVTRAVLAMCENVDWNVGRLVDKVDELGLRGDTVFIYLSDNGPNTWRWNGDMRGKKGSTEEGGVRSPCLINWPGKIEPGTRVKQIAGAIDFLPTLADIAGISLTDTKPLDGVSLKPIFDGETDSWPERVIYSQSHDGEITGIRTQKYRAGGHSDGLFDMENDFGQRRDLSAEKPQLFQELKNRIEQWHDDAIPSETVEPPLPVGYPAFPKTDLNAQDGVPGGEITWSSIHPNASFFTDWRNIDDEIHWDLDIANAGRYEVTVFYTCPESETGAKVEVVCGEASTSATIEEPFDPPLKTERDRIPRSESYEKEFRPLKMGVVNLKEGRQELRLRALRQVGETICDVRKIELRLIEMER